MNKSIEKKAWIIVLNYMLFILLTVVFIWNNNVEAQIKLKNKIPELCYECHEELKENLSDRYLHFLFKRGSCVSCHNSHVSNIKGLMNDEINVLCLGCHEKLRNRIEKAAVHGAIRDGICSDCHKAHSGENEHLLVGKEKTLCLNCHEEIKDQTELTYACLPFNEGKCSVCHDSHASEEKVLLLSNPNILCQECHGPKCKAGDVSISSAVRDEDCTSCHSGHSSVDKGVLGPFGHSVFLSGKCGECHNPIAAGETITTRQDGDDLCYDCHGRDDPRVKYVDNDVHVKDVKNSCVMCHDHHASDRRNFTKSEPKLCIECHEMTEKRTASMEKALKSIKCAPVKDRKCFECHIPMHSDSPLNFSGDGIQICSKCHAAQHKITHPLGEEVIDVRNGQPVTCISCHSMHAAKSEFMLTHDKDRAICIQCHKM
jgi:predicted CXXCH cytochrome family protein